LNERFEQYINGKRENLHSNFTLRLKKILWEARSTPTLANEVSSEELSPNFIQNLLSRRVEKTLGNFR
jgi:hypothetical protein